MNVLSSIKSRLGLGKINPDAHLTESKVFCMAPWVQLHAQTNGTMAPCCMAAIYDGNETGNLREDSDLRNAWNSPKMKTLRRNMVEGKTNTICRNCYSYESLGKCSERMQYNLDFKNYYNRVTQMLRDGTVLAKEIPVIDIRFSNKCNYKCRICNSKFSSQWYEEEFRAETLDPDDTKEMKAAGDEAVFWESFKSLLPYLERLHFAGGEPLFMDEHYEVLEHLIAIGKTDVNLTYNSNFSTLRYKKYNVTELWNKFKKVDIWASLDGMGPQGDYQRKGQKWKDVEQNIRSLQKDCPEAIFGVNVTVSIFNILHIPAFIQHLIENKLVRPGRINLYLLFGPKHFTITTLPRSVKEKALMQFNDMETGYLNSLPDTSRLREHIKSVTSYMLSEDEDCREDFQRTIRTVDALRNENFISVFPELAEMMAPQ